MGTRWGINRTVAQIHALLYLSPEPLHAEDIARLLSVARSNVSSSLRELQSWGIVRIAHVLGDRRDHFESLKDVWQMFQIIVEERKRREVDPTIAMLRGCEAELKKTGPADSYTAARIAEMIGFFETTTALLSRIEPAAGRRYPPGGQAQKPVEEVSCQPGGEGAAMTPFFVRRFQSLQKGLSLMKIAITGATGFVGRHLARSLSYSGHELVLDRPRNRRARPHGPAHPRRAIPLPRGYR